MAVTDEGLSPETGQQEQQDLGFTRRANPAAKMPLMEHIRELRNRIIKIAVVLVVGAVIGWFVYPYVWHFIEAPYCRIPVANRHIPGTTATGCALYVTGVFDALLLKVQISIITGVVITSPIWLYQLWAFIAPGLYRRERRWAYFFIGAAVPLFAIGATLSYFTMTRGLHFLLDMIPHNAVALITINTYLSYAEAMLLVFGIAFEVPLAFILLNLAGVLTHARFRKWRRSIIFLVFVFAAVATPSPDPITMLILAVPCVLLVEATELFAYVHDKRKAARLGSLEFPGMTEEEVAQLGLSKPLGEQAGPDGAVR